MLWLVVVEWLARSILLLLIGLSVWSISIIIERRRFFKALTLPNEDLKKNIRNKNFSFQENHFYSQMLKELSSLKSSEQMDSAFDAISSEKRKELEKGLPIL